MPYEAEILSPPPPHTHMRRPSPTGSDSSVPGQSCKHIKDTLAIVNQCHPLSGIYWVKFMEQCPGKNQTMQVSEAVEEGIQYEEHNAFLHLDV